MANPYIQFPDLYNAQTGNASPYQQNIASQQQSMQQLLQQGSQLGNPNVNGTMNMGNSSTKDLANALRNMGQTVNAYAPWTQNQIANTYGTDPYSEQSRMLAMQERGM